MRTVSGKRRARPRVSRGGKKQQACSGEKKEAKKLGGSLDSAGRPGLLLSLIPAKKRVSVTLHAVFMGLRESARRGRSRFFFPSLLPGLLAQKNRPAAPPAARVRAKKSVGAEEMRPRPGYRVSRSQEKTIVLVQKTYYSCFLRCGASH